MAGWYDYNNILSEEQEMSRFCDWFWSGSNGNNLIHALNGSNRNSAGSKIRRLCGWWPYIYCIVINDDTNPGPGLMNTVQWKYCKVGITEQDTKTGAHNRMETVIQDIKRKVGLEISASVIFVLPVCAIDSRKNGEIEQGVREHIGWKVNKDFAKCINLPVPTEWVITTQPYLGLVKNCIRQAAEMNCAIDTRLVLSMGRFQQHEGMLPPHLQKQEDEVVGKCDGTGGPFFTGSVPFLTLNNASYLQ